MGTILDFPGGKTMHGTHDEIRAEAFANYYTAERRRGVDPETAYERAGRHIVQRFDRLIEDLRVALKEA